MLGLVQASPLLGLPMLGGMLADRWPRRTALLATQAMLAIAMGAGVQALGGLLTVPWLLFLAGLLAGVAAIDNAVRQVYLPGVVDVRQRGWVIGMNALAYNTAAFIGPALAGLLLPTIGAGWCFILNGFSFLLTLGSLLVGPSARPRDPIRRDFATALRYVHLAIHPRQLLFAVAVISLLTRSYPHMLPVLAGSVWGADAHIYRLLAALPGLGAMLAASLVTWWLRSHQQPSWEPGPALLRGALIGLGLVTNAVMAGGLLVLAGFTATFTMTVVNATLQAVTPDALRGRVMSLYIWLAAGMPALGAWLVGSEMRGLELPTAISTAGGALLLAIFALMIIGRPEACKITDGETKLAEVAKNRS